MTRTAAREIAILLSFSAAGADETVQERLDRFFEQEHYASMAEENALFAEFPDEQQMDYIRTLAALIAGHREELDGYIERYARGWKAERISRMAGAILRCAMSEILYLPDVPNAAAINEAVELAKKYEDTDVVAFINGVLGGFVRGEIEDKQD
ncbi:MAG: transcription antitermination factor NusB [Ruminococcaceae bacterium]|nr:transcription antitermination factor NusB [Oscillospiraceae bacterium]